MPSTFADDLPSSAIESRKVHISCWHTLLNAAGKNTRTAGPFFNCSLRVTFSRSWLGSVKSGALAPTSTDMNSLLVSMAVRCASILPDLPSRSNRPAGMDGLERMGLGPVLAKSLVILRATPRAVSRMEDRHERRKQ